MQAHSTDEQASVAVAIAVEFALQAGAHSLSPSLSLVLVAVIVGCSPLPLPLRSRTKAAAMHFLPNARIRIPYNVVLRSATDSLPESLTAWLTGWRSGGLAGCLEMQSSTQCSRAANTTHKVIFILRPQVPLLLGFAGGALSWPPSLCCHYED